MVEMIKELSVILKDLPDLAIWIMVGILFYKTFIIGGTLSLARFAISKLHDFMTKPKRTTVEYSLYGIVYTHEGALNHLKDFLREVRAFNNEFELDTKYILFIRQAYKEKLEREGIKDKHEMSLYAKKNGLEI